MSVDRAAASAPLRKLLDLPDGGGVYEASSGGMLLPPGHMFDIRDLTGEEVEAHGVLAAFAIRLWNVQRTGDALEVTPYGLAETAASIRLLGLLDMPTLAFRQFCRRRGLTGGGFEGPVPFRERLVVICERADAAAAAAAAHRLEREAAREARLAANRQEEPKPSERPVCSSCARKPALYEGLCKRCAYTAGLLGHGKIGAG